MSGMGPPDLGAGLTQVLDLGQINLGLEPQLAPSQANYSRPLVKEDK